MGAYLAGAIRQMMLEYPEIGDVRQVGLHIGLEFVRDPVTKEPLAEETAAIRGAGLRHGVIFGLGGVRKNVLKVKPPLIVTRSECDEILSKLELSVREVLRSAAKCAVS